MTVVTMQLGGVSIGPLFPLYGKAYEPIRLDDQGASIKKVRVTLSGFIEGDNHGEVMATYQLIKAYAAAGDITFTYYTSSDYAMIHDNQRCWVESYNEPVDGEYGKNAVGDYSITLYWFEDSSEGLPLTCTYVSPTATPSGTYTFAKTPKWSRSIKPNRSNHRARRYGSTAEINLEGILYAANHSALKTAIDNLTATFSTDGVLTYGGFSNTVRCMPIEISPVTPHCYAMYKMTFFYDIGSIVSLSCKTSISRIHSHPVITELPFCDSRLIEQMNSSGQTIDYSFSITAESIATARSLLATEVTSRVLVHPDMIEMPGGKETWDEDEIRVDLNFTKFYPTPVVLNLSGT